MNDFSFIRLDPDFTKATSESFPLAANIAYWGQIYLHPQQKYTQITNTPLGIAFDGNYLVKIIDACGTELLDITDKVAISEFTDNNGLPQIAFEIVYINQSFYKPVFLKFIHTVSDYVWYSNAINITDYQEEQVSRADYRCVEDFHGTAYNRANIFQSIGLKFHFETNDSESKSSQYTSINGTQVTSRLIETEFENYIFDQIDNFTYRRFNKLLSNQIIYVNGNRVTDKQTLSSKSRLGDTNVQEEIEFKLAINYKETYTPSFQIFEPLKLISRLPEGYYTLASLPSSINGTFNRPITELTGTIQIIDTSDDSVVASFDETEINTVSDNFEIPDNNIMANGSYKIVISAGLFLSSLNELNPVIEWFFIVSDGDYLVTDYSSDYFTS